MHWISLFVKPKYTVYFDSFGVEHISQEINKFIGNKKVKASIFRIQAYDSIMCGYFCIEFINYVLKGKTLLDYTNFLPMTLKRTIELLKEYLRMNKIIELTDVNKYRLDEINKIRDILTMKLKKEKI